MMKVKLFSVLAAVVLLTLPMLASGVPGDAVRTITVPVPSPGLDPGIGIAVDCDGKLYYTNSYQATLYFTDAVGTDLGSVPITDVGTGLPVSVGAISWDATRGMLWGGTDNSGVPCQIYLIDPVTGDAVWQFTACTSSGIGFCDGIAYDGTDDTVWFTDDISSDVCHFRSDGFLLGILYPTDAAGNPLNLISGVSVGKGNILYLGRNGLGEIVKVDKTTGAYISSFATIGGRDEDLECDVINFAPLEVLWSKDAWNNTVTAIEVEEGTCVCPGEEPCFGIDLWMEDLIVNPGENVLVPIYIEDVTGWGVLGFDMEICWCDLPAGLIEFEYCQIGEVMTASGWGDPVCGPCGDNCISIAGAGTGPLVGEGVLFYLKFAVSTNAKPCMCCDIRFTHINLYDPEDPLDVCWEDGSLCVEWCDVEGTVNYWKCCFDECDEPYFIRQLDGAYIHISDCVNNHIESQYTDVDGYYLFDCLDPLAEAGGCYWLTIDYCPILPCVTSMDAALVLQNVVCLDDLDDCPFNVAGGIVYPQQVAADVNCSGVITSLDASYILQYSVGLINIFPCPDPWRFYAIPGNTVTSCPGTVDWIGVMYGDVNGCPECPPSGLLAAAGPTQASVKLGRAVHFDDRVEIPVKVKDSQDVMAVDLTVNYDVTDFSVASVEGIGLADGFSMAYNPVSGELRIAMAGMTRFSGNGKIAKITLEKNQPVATTAGVSISEAYFNDTEVRVEGNQAERKVAFGLGPIAPNPFVDGTSVKFSMARSAPVTLSIYNVNGQLVKTLVDGEMSAGAQQVTWDGSDMAGNTAARGVYFCRMSTEDFTATTKILRMQ